MNKKSIVELEKVDNKVQKKLKSHLENEFVIILLIILEVKGTLEIIKSKTITY